MAINGNTWPHMVIHGNTWQCLAIHGNTKLYMTIHGNICDPPQDFNAKGEGTRTTRFHFKTKEFILTRLSTLAILPH